MVGEPAVGKAAPEAAHWKSIPLREAGTWLSGGTPSTANPAYWGGEIPWISGASLKSFRITDSERRLTPLGARSGSRLVSKGTTLFVVRGMSLKSEFRIGVAAREMAFGQDVKALVPADGIDPHFLAYTVRAHTDQILRMVEDTSHGTGRLDTDRLQELEIRIPPLAEQRRIVAAHTAVERRIAALEKVASKRAQVLDALVEQLLRAGGGLIFPLKEAGVSIDAGITLGSHRAPSLRPAGYLRVANVRKGWIEGDIALLEAMERDHHRYSLKSGDLLVVEGHADPEQIGRCAVAGADQVGLLYQNHLFRLRFEDVLPEFAMLWLNSRAVRSYWKSQCATSSGLYTINSRLLENVPFPRVGRKEQERVVGVWKAESYAASLLNQHIDKLRKVQRGVVEDLLTGVSKAHVA
ncbi:Type I restriction modification DNA specificity domain-containing protein [Amycolatopsis tolypomycina]|uniref:Type I restriction modification DNA specificity domain-containing protein n=1 Tax=Amycolatopsis tolypomycina TaxID=208445 RepID=A0A1H5BW73_9PSEU|nr:restriction endonuclease subunit S [Amycolatopsis tolypomycina]SED58645.1 Type I restriction modification DNA specificity domain-containing protein [Amycolatopsis tolypomycina]